ncbi:response regulator [Candidatus Latescibacterota bacterium]
MNSNQKKHRVLVADDTESITALMKHILTKNGFDVEIAEDGEQCLEKIETFQPDLVVLDIMMPKLHGMDVLKELKKKEVVPGVIICTSKSYKPDIEQAKEIGIFDVIIKPFQQDEFINTVKKYFLGWVTPDTAKESSVVSMPSGEAYLPKIDTTRSHYHLWGTRGSIPVSGHQYNLHGGNTSCFSIECGDDIVIIDAGSGIRELGMVLAAQKPRKIHIFIGHTHWDHIQGFPFFIPAYIPGYQLVIYGASGFGKDLQSIFQGQLDSDYFPVQMEDMRANFEFKNIKENPVKVGDISIYWEYTHHPGPTLGFKVSVHDKTIGYITDNEFLKGFCGHPEKITSDSEQLVQYSKLIEFISGVDILISEAQYTNDEYRQKIGWGHSSLSNACLLMKLAGIKEWIVTHHDPSHSDEVLQKKLNLTKQIFSDLKYNINISHGFDGKVDYL